MKRFLVFFNIMIVFASTFLCTAFAANPSIVLKSAKADSEGSFVDVSGRISNVNEEQYLTYLLTEVKDESYNEDEIYYINQKIYSDSEGNFTFKLGVKGTLDANKTYIVRIGGTNISEPVSIIVGTDNTGTVKFVLGDVNGDGVVNANDAVLGMNYLLDPLSVDGSIVSADRFEEKIRVMGKDGFAADDVACILEKAINSNFVFPADANK